MSVLCAVIFTGCNDIAGEQYSDKNRIEPTPTVKTKRLVRCIVPRIDYTTAGVVETRAAYNPAEREGALDVTSYHEFVALYGTDTIRHTYTGRFVVNAFDVKKVRYAHNSDIFKNPVITPSVLADGRTLNVVTFKDGNTHDFDIALVEELPIYEEDTYQVGDSTFTLCKNERVLLELIDSKVEPTTSPDEKYNAYTVALYFQYGLSEGPDNKKTFLIRLPQVLVPKDGPDVPLPEEKHDIIAFEDVDKGYDLVNDSINNRWIDLVKVMSDGSREPFPRVAFVSKNRLFAPEYQIKQVSDFEWQSQTAKAFDATPSGDWQKRENNIYVMPMMQVFTTYTDKGNCVFTGDFDGQAYFVDSLNQKHYFLYKEYTFEDDGWQRSDMQPTENFERKLLTSDMRGFFNGAELPRKGEIELRKVKDAEKEIIGYWYSPLDSEESGLKPIVPNSTYWTWRTQYILFSDGSKEKVGEVGTTLNLNTVAPEKQVVTVTDWDIKDLSAQGYNATRTDSRTDKQETGTFTIYAWSKKYVTRTNKSSDNFVTTYDGTVTFKDKYGQEVEFLALAVKQEDKGGVATLKNLPEADEMERKSMTTSIRVTETNTSTSAESSAEIEFRKAVEKEELTDWKVTSQDLVYNGNGNWTSTTTVTYYWKLAGTKTETYSTGLVWNIIGEAKAQVILDEAKADYRTLNAGSETSSTSTNGNITVVTRKKAYSEDYTTLKDNFTATMQTASYKSIVDGKTIAFDFLSPTGMTVAHKDGSLVNGNRTTTKDGTEYDVWDHTGSVTATVVSPKGNQTETAVDEKEVLVKKAVKPSNPEWGKPVRLLGQGTAVYQPGVGPSGQGVFYCNFNVQYEKGVVCYVTNTYIREGHTNPQDFAATGFWPYGAQLRGATLRADNVGDLNSAIFRDGKFEPACCTYIGGKGVWTYMSPDGREQGMTENLAETCGLKHFTGTNTAHLQPILYYTAKMEGNALVIRNQYGGVILSLR